MKNKPLGILLTVLIALGIFISLDLSLGRIKVERSNKQLELAVEYGEVKRISRWSGLTVAGMMDKLAERGATGILFKEESNPELAEGDVWIRSGGELLAEGVIAPERADSIDRSKTYLVTDNEGKGQRIWEQLKAKAPQAEFLEIGDLYIISSGLGPGELKNLGLGFDQAGIQAAREAGLNILLQLQSWPQATSAGVSTVFKSAIETEGLTALLFNDRVLPGYPGSLETILLELNDSEIPLGIIEFMPQQGLAQLVQNLNKRAVRLHAISEGEMAKLTPQKAIDRFSLAAAERNNRILLIRFFSPATAGNWAEYNLKFLQDLRDKLEKEGFTFGKAEPFQSLPTSRIKLFFLGAGVLAGAVLLLEKFLSARLSWILGGAALLIWLGMLIGGFTNFGRTGMALGAVVIFPSLALINNLRTGGKSLVGSLKLLLKTSVFSLIGAVLMIGLLTDTSFMLKLQEFRGVKVAHVLPLILVVVFCFLWQERENWPYTLTRLWNSKISVGWAFLGVVLALGLLIYVSRTGNESAAVSGLELELRNLLDKLLVVRPRTKEFLIGHPLLMLVFYLGYQHKYLPLLVLGAIGQVSLVNTFAHLHTPLLISVFRSVNGLWLGALLGVAVIFAYQWAVKLKERVEDGL
ncbi:MAG: DUF5693 family protein [Bacillota bacterium]